MMNKFTKRAEDALRSAKSAAEEMGHTFIGTEHILIGLISEKSSVASKMLEAKGADKNVMINKLFEISGKGETSRLTPEDMTPRAKKALLEAGRLSKNGGTECIGTEHILSSILTNGKGARRLLSDCGIAIEELEADISVFFCSVDEMKEKPQRREASERFVRKKENPTLAQYGKNLTEDALKNDKDPIIGREKEISRVITILARKTKNNPLLIGEPGVGKTAIAEGLAMAIAKRSVPETLYGKQIICLDISSMIAGAKYRGEFEERLKNALSEAMNDKDVILFIDEIHTIIGAGSAEGAMDAANILKPPLARGEIRVIGATTYNEYTKHIERDAALERRFQSVRVNEPSEDDTMRILVGIKSGLERHHSVKIDDEALSEAIALSIRYMPDRYLPDKAIDVLDEAASYLSLKNGIEPSEIFELRSEIKNLRDKKEKCVELGEIEKAERYRKREISKTNELVNKRTDWEKRKKLERPVLDADGVKESVLENIGEEYKDSKVATEYNAKDLLFSLKSHVFGQDRACSCVSETVLRSKIGLRDSSKPLASFIFCGASGVGKTALARTLAEKLYGKNSFLKLDMSEYSEKQSISKLIGSPPGYVGYDEPGKLTQFVRNNPDCVILFDEIDKACTEVKGLLLQILDDGILSDSRGRRGYFKSCVIIITCNTGVRSRSIGFSSDAEVEARGELDSILGAEIVSRFDEIIRFTYLDNTAKLCIAEKAVNQISEHLAKLGFLVKTDKAVIQALVDKCNEGEARGVLRAVSKYIERPISGMIMDGEIALGEEYIIRKCGDSISCVSALRA